MKKTVTILSVILCCACFMGASRQYAPVLPSKNFYINDYANVLSAGLRDSLLGEARKVNEKTGAQVALLTVDSLGEMDGEQYASLIFNGWDIGGTEHKNGVLILVDTDGKQFYALGSDDFPNITAEEWNKADTLIKAGKFAEGTGTCYIAYINAIYTKLGTGETAIFEDLPQTPDKQKSPFESRYAFIVGGLAIIILIRVLRISMSTRSRMKKSYTYRPKSFTNTYSRTGARRDDEDYPSGFSGSIIIKNRTYNDNFDEHETIEEARSKIEAHLKEDGIEIEIVDERR